MSESRSKVRVALLGGGTVGGGVMRLLEENADRLTDAVGAPIELAHVLVRNLDRPRVSQCKQEWLTTDPERVFNDSSVDIVVEVMGGTTLAKEYIKRALAAGKDVVSANKSLLARCGPELVASAAKASVDLAFEASVGGGVPVIRTLRDALRSDRVSSVHGLLNGTCNYILTRMEREGVGYEQVLEDAQKLGYAEAEPSLDVDGHDATQKLVVLSMLAFGAAVDDRSVSVEGIREIDQLDFRFAERFGFTIKHLVVGVERGAELELRAHPAFVPNDSPLAGIHGVLNGVLIQGVALGPCLLVGQGAGALPTAVSVVADIVDVARSRRVGAHGAMTRSIQPKERPLVELDTVTTRYYLRFEVQDEPGVLGNITSALGAQGVSVEHIVQETIAREGASDEHRGVPVLMITHECPEGKVKAALGAISAQPFMKRPPRFIRIEKI